MLGTTAVVLLSSLLYTWAKVSETDIIVPPFEETRLFQSQEQEGNAPIHSNLDKVFMESAKPDKKMVTFSDETIDEISKPHSVLGFGNVPHENENTPGPDSQNDAVARCNSKFPKSKVADEKNCSQYILVCPTSAGNKQLVNDSQKATGFETKSCPTGKYFDSIDAECVNKNEAQCGPYTCQENGFFPDQKNPAKFIQCLGNGPRRLQCEPEGTTFNIESKVCLWNNEEPSILLKLFKALIWFVKLTESRKPGNSSPKSDTIYDSRWDYLKIASVAVLIPFMYIFTVSITYWQLYGVFTSPENEPSISDAEEFRRYFPRPPTRSVLEAESVISLRNLGPSSTLPPQPGDRSNETTDNIYATTRM